MSTPFERQLPEVGPRFPECHLAEVISVQDPDNLGRVQLRLLSYDGLADQDSPVWARVAVPVAGGRRGTFLIPDVGDEVVVNFIAGDPRRPVVVGSLWNGGNTPTETLGGSGERVDRWSFTGHNGTHISVVEENQGQASIKMELPNGISAELTESGSGKIELSALGSTITLEPSGIKLQTSGSVEVSASRMTVSAAQVSVDAAVASFSGVVRCTTLQATTVIGTTYTPGAGNVW